MPIWRMQCSFGADGPLPRDRFVITPHFQTVFGGDEVQGLCEDLANALNTYCAPQATREINVKAYDAQGTAPVAPQGDFTVNSGAFPGSPCVREVALCLSYFSGFNRPRTRGRLYIPWALRAGSNSVSLRPSQADIDKITELVPHLTGLGGIDVDWGVYSRVNDSFHPVSDWYVDNEWDIMRSRGLRPTARTAGTASE